jgi:hypothetical protein
VGGHAPGETPPAADNKGEDETWSPDPVCRFTAAAALWSSSEKQPIATRAVEVSGDTGACDGALWFALPNRIDASQVENGAVNGDALRINSETAKTFFNIRGRRSARWTPRAN